ncbi:MAG: hypothetical protein U9N57_08420 [Pseudomonadota bacterium]|nr:hypothetical protein [Pseudomonadota bacterium]
MDKPFWFKIIEQWKEMGKGEYGVTFPFLIGAIAKASAQEPNDELVRKTFQEIIENPFPGYYCEVRQCGNINEPVASVKKVSEIHNVSIKSKFSIPGSGDASLAFTTDLMSMFALDCSSEQECLEKLVALTNKYASEGNFSKNAGSFTPFTVGDLEFIEVVENQ